ncbi:MAG: multicopper oxidase domain-containing protein [Geobacter sp.]|nr:multicopper oxidase domain-containing protein [Geobacter sp.]
MKNRKTKVFCNLLLAAMLCMWAVTAFAGNPLAIPTGPKDANGNWAVPDYNTTANWAFSPQLTKFVDTLAPLGCTTPNNLGQCIPVAVPDTTTYPGSDYYIIELREYSEKMHSDLNPTKLRGYVQVNAAGNDVAPIHYMGPIIVAQRDRPVRIKFTNKLPAGAGGDLFIPVDTSVMGAGKGPAYQGATRGTGADCDNTVDGNTCASYAQNRATIHLHGGRTPWISDGTPHQWITPANENTPYPQGVSVQNVPDMPNPGDGSMTFYYSNQQSARLLFYHDHAFGITRLNVYAGMAAGYVITDTWDQDLITRGILPPDQIPLIIQDRTFVDATPTTHPVTGQTVPKIRITDPLWNWGSGTPDGNGIRPPVTGDLWLPHVYMPAQNPYNPDLSGVNPFGRWMYGPWFYPPTVIKHGPVANPYHDPDCDSTDPFIYAQCTTPGQPPVIPGTPHPSMGMEAFLDTMTVNGTVLPVLEVDPRAYRFRILNADNDRGLNLSLYKADPTVYHTDNRRKSNLTEVKMVSAAPTAGWPALWPTDGREGGVPDPGTLQGDGRYSNWGPTWLQIGTESGFLPNLVEREPQPITYITDPTAFAVGVVKDTSLAVMPAERADVVVDFSQYAGQTLILYNDAPTAWPALDVRYDYYTGAPDQRDVGGFGTGGTYDPITGSWVGGTGTLPGKGPNTRTVMQIKVRSSVQGTPYSFSKAALQAEFTSAAPVTAANPTGAPLFARAQEPIIVGQAAYQNAYPNSYFPVAGQWRGTRSSMLENSLSFLTIDGKAVIVPMEPKGIHDEMGASFDPEYGRMSGNLAMEIPNPRTNNANLILYGFSDIPTETIQNSPEGIVKVKADVLYTLDDGTQIWNISHNGVDTHPIHFHIFDVQLINRLAWDGQIYMPDPNELGWKDTVRISPLMDTIVAVRPVAPALPFGIPNSMRPLNPAIPIGSGMGFNSVDWVTGQARVPAVTNILYDFGWEYVWHCHILSHEEMDMMRPIVLQYTAMTPPGFTSTATTNQDGTVSLSWVDPTPVIYTSFATYGDPAGEIGFNVWRSTDGTNFTKINAAKLLANATSYTDTTAVSGTAYSYKIEAFSAKGSTFSSVASPISVTVAANGGPFAAPGPITLEATLAGIPAGVNITQVAFFDGATQIGVDTTPGAAPYQFVWSNVAKGNHSITAQVTDSLGGVAISAPVTVAVTGALTASFTATGSANGADIGFCETITFTSTSTASSGSITGYSWTINGVNYLTQNVSTTLPVGTYPVTLAVTNSGTGEVAQVTSNVTVVNHNPTAIPGGPYTVAPGGSVTLNGSGTDTLDSCNTTPLTYAWNVDNKGAYDFFTANPTIPYNTLKTVLGIGTFTMTLQVTDSNGGVGTATTTVTVAPPPVTSVTLTPDVASPRPTGTTVTFTAAAVGGYLPQYEFWLRNPTGVWTMVQAYSTTNTYVWTPTVAGTYVVQVRTRSTGSTSAFQAFAQPSYTITAPVAVTSVTLTPNMTSPRPTGTIVTFTAAAVGGYLPQYEFWLRDTAGTWTMVQAYSTTNTYVWTPTVAGTYVVQVRARSTGSTSAFQAYAQPSYTIQ